MLLGATEPGGGWQWVTGEPWIYENWAARQPDQWNPGEDYLHFFGWKSQKAATWNDIADSRADFKIYGYVLEGQ